MSHRNRNGRVVLMSNPRTDVSGVALNSARAVARLRQLGLEVEHIAGVDRLHAEELAQSAVASRPEAFLVVGGDREVSMAIQALAGSDIPLGIIPSGAGNDAARNLALPLNDAEAAADIAAGGRTRRIDLGLARLDDGTERYFLGVTGADFAAGVFAMSRRLPARFPRKARFLTAALAQSYSLRAHRYEITTDDGRDLSGMYYLAAVGNMRSYGGGVAVCPTADLYDGQLDLTLVSKTRWAHWRMVQHLFQSYRGGLVPDDVVSFHRVRSVRVDGPVREMIADGHLLGPVPVTLTAVPRALHVLVQ